MRPAMGCGNGIGTPDEGTPLSEDSAYENNLGDAQRPFNQDVLTVDPFSARGSVKVTGYRILNTFLSIVFISVKAFCSIKTDVNPALSAMSDWTLGGIVAVM